MKISIALFAAAAFAIGALNCAVAQSNGKWQVIASHYSLPGNSD